MTQKISVFSKIISKMFLLPTTNFHSTFFGDLLRLSSVTSKQITQKMGLFQWRVDVKLLGLILMRIIQCGECTDSLQSMMVTRWNHTESPVHQLFSIQWGWIRRLAESLLESDRLHWEHSHLFAPVLLLESRTVPISRCIGPFILSLNGVDCHV